MKILNIIGNFQNADALDDCHMYIIARHNTCSLWSCFIDLEVIEKGQCCIYVTILSMPMPMVLTQVKSKVIQFEISYE